MHRGSNFGLDKKWLNSLLHIVLGLKPSGFTKKHWEINALTGHV
jgi:hypothetical protein